MDYELTEGDSEVKEKGLKQVYITLGHLLVLIMATGGLYTKKDNKAKPFIYIDVNPDTRFDINKCSNNINNSTGVMATNKGWFFGLF